MTDLSSEREALVQHLLDSSPRLQETDSFLFSCHPGISCFNNCCTNVNILLSPLDILRMSRRLQISTSDFLARYTLVPFSQNQRLPFVFLKMNEDEKKTCPFVSAEGCTIYSDRPWPCRMYPLGEASPENERVRGERFYFLLREDHCRGHEEKQRWKIYEWLAEQGVNEYQEIGELFKQIILHPYLVQRPLDPARMEMFYMACYDLDRFRRFILESRFLERFVLPLEQVEALRSNDLELLRFAFRWLRFALFGEMTLDLRVELLSERERKLLAQRE